MVVCNFWNTLFQSHKHLYSLFMITLFFLIIIPCATPLSFNLNNIGPNDTHSINCTGDANITLQGIQVTPDPDGHNGSLSWKTGRATYMEPLHLWDKASQNTANFTTRFSFVIYANSSFYGDGLAFFLVPNGSNIPPDTGGSGLGLASENDTTSLSANKFVAVEFDTYRNPSWDPDISPITHIGININSMRSVEYVRWRTNITDGKITDAEISYHSSSQNLTVIVSSIKNDTVQLDSVYYIVDLSDYLPEWVTFGFSAATGANHETHSVKSWEFNSTSLQIDDTGGKNKNKIGLVVGLSAGSCVLVGGLALVGFVLWNKRRRGKKEDDLVFDLSMDDEFEMGSGPKKFLYDELARATNNFAEEEKLGEGGFGGVYRGFLRELNSYAAVKRISRGSKQGLKEYASEVKIISRLRHRNLVQLIGWCHEKRELLLVYEFMPNGSLDFHLFKGKSLLTWAVRYKIVQGLASALLYLHEEWEQCVVHRDIKSSNIMLDSNFNAKLGDFGLARLVDHGKGSQTTVLAGTMGYMAPECVVTGKASKESDVYSFGVVALEIACGRKPIDPAKGTQTIMLEWVWDLYGNGKLLEAADPKLCADFDEQAMECLLIVGLWCVHPDHNLRPSIRQAIHVLNFEAPLPILPSKMPVPTYFAPPVNSLISLSYGTTVSESSHIQSASDSYNTDSSKVTTSSAASSPSASLLFTK